MSPVARQRPEWNELEAARFWARVDRSGGPTACWPWTGPVTPTGYGHVLDGAHRVALGIHLGRRLMSRVELACHHCDNPPCCNPVHLFAATHKENTEDARRKGRLYYPKAGKREVAA